MQTTARSGDVYLLPIPGDNGQTKDRFCVVLDIYPTLSGAQVVSFVFGCSETKRGACVGTFVRVEREPAAQFRSLGLANATTFHQEDIRHYDAWSPKFAHKSGFCTASLMIELRKLSVARNRQAAPIPLLPERAREDARQSSRAWQQAKPEAPESAPDPKLAASNIEGAGQSERGEAAALLAPDGDPDR